jgi:hypothetical protein
MRTGKLIRSIVLTATKERGAVGRTRLMKFLYLADVLFFRKEGKIFTGYPWKFYHFGPWAQEAQQDIDLAATTHLIETESTTGEAGDVYLYKYRGQDPEIWRELGLEFETALRREIKRWIAEPLEKFLDYIYFDTPPMRDAQRGDLLTFRQEAEELGDAKPAVQPRLASSQRAKEALAKFLTAREGAARLPKDAIYDDLFQRAAAILDAEDIPSTQLRGSAEVGKEAGLRAREDQA